MTPADLKQWRTARNLTQDDLAHLLGVSTNTVYRWEQGSRAIPPYLNLALQTLSRRKAKAVTPPRDRSAVSPVVAAPGRAPD